MTLPAKFAERVLRDLGDSEGPALCAALDTEPPVSVRLNPAKCGGTENGGAGREEDADKVVVRPDGVPPGVLADADGRVPWCGDGYYLAARPQFTFDSDFHAGAYYVQEAASQFARTMIDEGVISEEAVQRLHPKKQIAGVIVSVVLVAVLGGICWRNAPAGYFCGGLPLIAGFLKYRSIVQFNSLTVQRFRNTYKDEMDTNKYNKYVDAHF